MIGIHVSKISKVDQKASTTRKHSMAAAIEDDCERLGLTAAQIFTHGPQNYDRNEIAAAEIAKIRGIAVSVHSSYPTVAIWKVSPENATSSKSKQILGHLRDQLASCEQIGATGLVVHISRQKIQNIVLSMRVAIPIASEFGVSLLLEMVASKAHPELTYESPDRLNDLTSAMSEFPKKSWGYCIDTAHIWGAGLDISDKKSMREWFKALSADTTKKIKMFHLNGSSSDRGSGKDKHAIPFAPDDKIYRMDPKNSGLAQVAKFCAASSVPIILEINRGSLEDATFAIQQIKRFGGH